MNSDLRFIQRLYLSLSCLLLQGYLCPNEFIATQGPLPSTVADFWRMIWETGTRTVAMLTQCYEKGRVRRYRRERISTSYISGLPSMKG